MNLDKYLDPPDEPEAVFCDDCGEEMMSNPRESYGGRFIDPPSFSCKNRLCPTKHEGVAKEMALLILEQQDTIYRLRLKLKVALS